MSSAVPSELCTSNERHVMGKVALLHFSERGLHHGLAFGFRFSGLRNGALVQDLTSVPLCPQVGFGTFMEASLEKRIHARQTT